MKNNNHQRPRTGGDNRTPSLGLFNLLGNVGVVKNPASAGEVAQVCQNNSGISFIFLNYLSLNVLLW